MPDHDLCCIRAVSRHDLEALIELCAEHATYEGALYGMFRTGWDVGLPLLSFNGVKPGQAGASDGTQELND